MPLKLETIDLTDWSAWEISPITVHLDSDKAKDAVLQKFKDKVVSVHERAVVLDMSAFEVQEIGERYRLWIARGSVFVKNADGEEEQIQGFRVELLPSVPTFSVP